ncbi:TIGR02391 family protein [Streptomyces sp. NBC_00536]|uniref:TIGR02391 family protein n=1 Tax=Streptomyces sp. NBC_00536 TaxID=2975769 RepID=UPI002E822D40|nr:TIGR02391 family protein [Streptomyces sp. NBC_00536]WUC79021.1 TIGR02391 family protein [Streptomyces sp. NBC_00536]
MRLIGRQFADPEVLFKQFTADQLAAEPTSISKVASEVATRHFSANALIPHGHHQDWELIEEIIREAERLTDQWPGVETEIAVKGARNLRGSYGSLIDAQIDLGDDRRDVTEVDISRIERGSGESEMIVSIILSKNQKDTSWVFASGPVKRVCEELVRNLQAFILQVVKYPEAAKVNSVTVGNAVESRVQHLHSAVRSRALARLTSGHGDEAVEEACKSVGARLRHLSGLDDDGTSLVTNTLGSRRLIAINDGATKSEISEQDGYMHLGMALFRAARNPRAHRPSDPNFNADEVVEWLSVASALHRALDRARVESKAP